MPNVTQGSTDSCSALFLALKHINTWEIEEMYKLNILSMEFCVTSLRGALERLAAGPLWLVFHILLCVAGKLFVWSHGEALMGPRRNRDRCHFTWRPGREEPNSGVSVVGVSVCRWFCWRIKTAGFQEEPRLQVFIQDCYCDQYANEQQWSGFASISLSLSLLQAVKVQPEL